MPMRTVCDTAWLDTLPPRQRICGLIEAAKLGLVCDPGLLAQMRACWLSLLVADPAATERLVRRAALGKARIVARDPRETAGRRDILNFGHTLGHALETAAGGSGLLHGEAVLLGMRAALRLSRRHAGLRADTAEDLDSFLAGLPAPRVRLNEAAVMAALRHDKKARGGRLRFVLLRAPGRPRILAGLPEADIRANLRWLLAEIR
jgi:3-dehydroquinate synthase